MFAYINLNDERLDKMDILAAVNFSCLKSGTELKEIGLLFEKISDEKEQAVLQQFSKIVKA
jgi:hypothetical protein